MYFSIGPDVVSTTVIAVGSVGSLEAVLGGSKFWDSVDAVMKERREKARKEEATLIKLEREKRRRRIRRRKAKLRIENEKKKKKMQEEGKYLSVSEFLPSTTCLSNVRALDDDQSPNVQRRHQRDYYFVARAEKHSYFRRFLS